VVDRRVRLLVFVASPSDTTPERTCLRSVVDELNRGVADDLGLILEWVGWETHSWPGVGSDAQDVINREIPDSDIIVGIFWKRLGTSTSRALSGTVEEIKRGLELRANGRQVEVLVYFNQAPYTPQPEELKQIADVLEFRRELEERGLLVGTYTGVNDFEKKVRVHLTQVVRRWVSGEGEITDREEKKFARKGLGGTGEWREQIMSGRLSLDIDPPLGGRSYAFVSEVYSALADIGFDTRAQERSRIILVELLDNVSRHAEGAASIDIQVIGERLFKTVEITVASEGRSFDVDKIVRANIVKLGTGDREHGLLRVRRLAGYVGSRSDGNGVTSVRCEIYQKHWDRHPILYQLPTVLPICFEYGFPKYLWIDKENYTEKSFELLRNSGPAIQNLFFAPTASLGAEWLGVEFTGKMVMSNDSTPVGANSPHAGFNGIWSALESYFHAMFQNRHVFVYAHDVPPEVKRGAAEWAWNHRIKFFDEVPRMVDWISRPSAELL
jgi:anti-sigma regulatory factor (Ser/Thr protein kinase)